MQVSVPGIYQKPAPYSEQAFTYSIALALTARSAAWAPLMASRPAAEPRNKLLIVIMGISSSVCRHAWRDAERPPARRNFPAQGKLKNACLRTDDRRDMVNVVLRVDAV